MGRKKSVLEIKTPREEMFEKGFSAIAVIRNQDLPKELYPILLDYYKGVYRALRIVPGDLVFKGDDWQLAEPSHVIYARHKHQVGVDLGISALFVNRKGEKGVITIDNDPDIWDNEGH
ncbi:MAG: hypothetical protein NTW17_02865 [Candidatus Pacearchaeota archaeon]|nr:hypothetical protein [Candidatus Pacearchaeota archaeon]